MGVTLGCSSHSNQGKEARRRGLGAPAKGEPSASEGAKRGDAWRQSLGRVALVNGTMGFVLVDIGTAPPPEAGAPLQTYTDSIASAQLAVSSYQRRPFLIADIVSGAPKVGDSVALLPPKPPVSSRKSGEDDLSSMPSGGAPKPYRPPVAPQGERESARASVIPIPPEEPRRILSSKPEPSPSVSSFKSTVKDPVPEADPGPVPVAEPPSENGPIIPGLPVSRRKTSE